MQFDPNSTPPCYKTQDEDVVIQQDDEIRIKIVGLRVDATDIVSHYCTLKKHQIFINFFLSLLLEHLWMTTWVWSVDLFQAMFSLSQYDSCVGASRLNITREGM